MRVNNKHDYWLWGSLSALIAIGAVVFFSGSIYASAHDFDNPYRLATRQWIYLWLGIVLLVIGQALPVRFWEKLRVPLYFSGVLLLILTLIPGIGAEVNGSRRWIRLAGFSFQSSEWMKFVYILFLAGYVQKFSESLRNDWTNLIKIIALPATFVAVLLLMEPDFGSVAMIMYLTLGISFIARAHLLGFLLLFFIMSMAMAILVVFEPYRMDRLLQFMDPWSDPFGSGYSLTHSLMALGRGGLTGVGIGNGIHKLGYLPEVHNDFIFSVLAEEFGFLGVVVVLVLFGILLWRLFRLSRNALKQEQVFAGIVVFGLFLLLLFQVFINIGSTIQLVPPKGLVLPFFSHGGSFILVFCIALSLVFRIEKELGSKAKVDTK